jgi:RNA polymerase sigma-70 factor (ECF subfamily)
MPAEVTRLLGAWREGEPGAGDRLIPLVYPDLRRLAARCMAGERRDHTLEPTALVHEAYLRLVGDGQPRWRDRLHFFAVASRTMRRVLVDHARARRTAKRGGGAVRIPLDGAQGAVQAPPETLLEVDRALDELAALDPRKARVIELRHFGGLTMEETAAVLGVSAATVALDGRMARAWLVSRVRGGGNGAAGAA